MTKLEFEGRDKTLQYKNKKNLYKILFIVILLSFIVSLVGCDWFSLGLLNIFDPQAQIKVSTDINLTEDTIDLEIHSINEVEFNGTGFEYEYEYYEGTTKVDSLTKMVGRAFYVAASPGPGTAGEITTVNDLPLYYQDAQDYITSHPLVTELTCTITLIGTDGAGYNITIPVTVDLPVLQPGVDFTPPVANIATTPDPPTGNPPLSIVFDASGSTDVESGIASYSWDFGDGSTGTGVVITHTFVSSGTFIVILTVTDFYGNEDIDTKVITVGIGEVGAKIDTTPSPATGFIPFTVGFDASRSTVASLPIFSYLWEFNDILATTATGKYAVHTFDAKGTYSVKLTVTDSAVPANVYVAFVTIIAEP